MANLTDDQKKVFASDFVTPVAQADEELTLAEQQAVTKINNQAQGLMQMKAALIETTASRGWFYVEKFADKILNELVQQAMDEDDDTKAGGLRRDAKGARKFKEELFSRIAIAKNQEPEQFLEVSTH